MELSPSIQLTHVAKRASKVGHPSMYGGAKESSHYKLFPTQLQTQLSNCHHGPSDCPCPNAMARKTVIQNSSGILCSSTIFCLHENSVHHYWSVNILAPNGSHALAEAGGQTVPSIGQTGHVTQ